MKVKGMPTLLAVCATDGGLSEEGLPLDQGIAQIAREIEAGLPEGTSVAAVNFESRSAYFSDYVLEELQGALVKNRKLVVVTDRSILGLLWNALAFHMSGEVSDESVASLGKWVGAQVIVTGGLTDMGGSCRIKFNAIDVETATRRVSPSVTVRRDRTVAFMLPAETVPPPEEVPAEPDPSLMVAYFNAGPAHHEAERYAEAVAYFTRALEVKKDDIAPLRYRGLAYYREEEYDKSIADYNQVLRLNPSYAEAYYKRGLVYYSKQDYDRAIADYNQALQLNPNHAKAYYRRGLACTDKAIADCNAALRLDPNSAAAYLNRSATYIGMKEYDKAIEDCSEALRLDPNYTDVYLNRGAAYFRKGKLDEAIADYTEALRLDPNSASTYLNRGNTYDCKGDYDCAIADYTQALLLDPNSTDAYTNRSAAYNNKGEYDRAIADSTVALRINPNYAGAYSNRARLTFARGN
jgi:tetratricopeptide (TPR) repeat protein